MAPKFSGPCNGYSDALTLLLLRFYSESMTLHGYIYIGLGQFHISEVVNYECKYNISIGCFLVR